ncbi:hypothetical protein [Streptomyces sp. NPDC006333]|uniref:hypothetical protein n=1 Tax=Streptomyces sp. NPDC006333 TaxID=3156753 RepID=UPI0033AE10C2
MLSAIRRVRMMGVAALTALSITTLSATGAFAAESGEDNDWGTENAGGSQIHSATQVDEAQDRSNNHAAVWVENRQVHGSFMNGPTAVGKNSTTDAAPCRHKCHVQRGAVSLPVYRSDLIHRAPGLES